MALRSPRGALSCRTAARSPGRTAEIRVCKSTSPWRLPRLTVAGSKRVISASIVYALTVALLPVSASEARAIGRDLPKDYLEAHGQLVKGQKPVHFYMVNHTQ